LFLRNRKSFTCASGFMAIFALATSSCIAP
jgi:hypothetical protein